MATYTTNGGIKKIATGDESGTWGTSTNTNFDIIDRLAVGVGEIALSGTTHTLTTNDGSTSDGQYHVLLLGGSPSGTNTITISPNDVSRLYVVKNNSGQSAVFSQGSGANVTVANGKGAIIYCDGAGAGAAVVDITASFTSTASLTDLGVTASAAELNYNDITTLGTVEASKVVTADASGNVTFPDNEVLIFGTGSDLQIYHAGTGSVITDQGTGNLYIDATSLDFRNAAASKTYATFADGGAVTLYHDNSAKFATTSVGADVTGEFIADSYNETYAATSGTTPTVNCETGNAFAHTLSGNTTFTFSNPPSSGTAYSFSIEIIQDASGSGYTVTWPTSVDWPSATAPTLTATASAKDVFVFYTRDGGTNWYGFTAGQALG